MKWPDRQQVEQAVRTQATVIARAEPRLCALGYFGSYARDEWGVGSDVDLVAVLDVPAGQSTPAASDLPWARAIRLPVSHDLFIYSVADLEQMNADGRRFAGTLAHETVWVHGQWPGRADSDAAPTGRPRTQ